MKKMKIFIITISIIFISKFSYGKEMRDNIDGLKLGQNVNQIFNPEQLNAFKFEPPYLKSHSGLNFALGEDTLQVFYKKKDQKIAGVSKAKLVKDFDDCLSSRDQLIKNLKMDYEFPQKSNKESRTLKNGTKTDQLYFYDNKVIIKFECAQYSKNEYVGKDNQSFNGEVFLREDLMTREFSNVLVKSGR